MRIFRAKIHETNGHFSEPEYMADEEYWKDKSPKAFLVNFWGLDEEDIESFELFEVIDGKEVQL